MQANTLILMGVTVAPGGGRKDIGAKIICGEGIEAMAPSTAVDSLQMRQYLQCWRTWSASVVARPHTSAAQLPSSAAAPSATSIPAHPLASALAPTSP